MSFEVLYFSLVLFGLFQGGEYVQVPAFASLRILLARIMPELP